MRSITSTILITVGTLLLVVGCGGGSASPNDNGAATSSDPVAVDGASAGPGDGATATQPDVTDQAPTPAPGGGGTAGDTCGLVTVAEMEGLFGVTGVTQQLFEGPPDTCDYQRDGAPFVAMVLTPNAGAFVFDAMAADVDSTTIDGIGDRAVYNSQHLLFLMQKGDAILSIQALDESRSEAERAELMEQIAAIAAGRM